MGNFSAEDRSGEEIDNDGQIKPAFGNGDMDNVADELTTWSHWRSRFGEGSALTHSHGWEKTSEQYKPKPEELKPEKSTVGDLIREVAAATHYRVTTFSVYCAALRRIAADFVPD